MRFSHRLFLLLILLLTGAPILAQEPSDVAEKRDAYDGFRYCQLHPLLQAIRATKVMYLFIFTF